MKDLAEICLVHAMACVIAVSIAIWTTSPTLAVLPNEVLEGAPL